jgi:hypothetical protein
MCSRRMTYPRCQGFHTLQQRFPRHLCCSEDDFRHAITALKVSAKLGRRGVSSHLRMRNGRTALGDLLSCAGGLVDAPARQPSGRSNWRAACTGAGSPSRQEARPAAESPSSRAVRSMGARVPAVPSRSAPRFRASLRPASDWPSRRTGGWGATRCPERLRAGLPAPRSRERRQQRAGPRWWGSSPRLRAITAAIGSRRTRRRP